MKPVLDWPAIHREVNAAVRASAKSGMVVGKWIVECFPEKSLQIQASMGHDADTIVNYYLGLGFTRDVCTTIRNDYLNDWGIVV